MPEALEAPPVVPVEPEIPQGIEGAMKAFEEVVTPKPKEPAKEPEKTPEPEPAKAPEKSPDKPVDPKATPPEKPENIWEKAPAKLKGEHYKTVRSFEDKISNYEKKIKEIESKKVEAPTDAKVIEQYTKQIKELEQRIAASDYRQSPDFKKQFVDRINEVYKDSVSEVAALKIHGTDAEGNATQRPATKEDFDQLFNLRGAALDQAIATFGPSAYRVAAMVRDLHNLSRQSESALQEHAANAEKTAKEAALAKQRGEETYNQHYEASKAELEKRWPDYFAADEKDPEAAEAIKQGYKFVDDTLANSANMTPDERAAANAVVRGRAAGFARVVLDNNRLKAELESLKGELGKFRKSDPGADAGAGQTTPAAEDDVPKGIDEAIKAFKG